MGRPTRPRTSKTENENTTSSVELNELNVVKAELLILRQRTLPTLLQQQYQQQLQQEQQAIQHELKQVLDALRKEAGAAPTDHYDPEKRAFVPASTDKG